MPTQVLMPALSPTMEEGKLAKWVKAEGITTRAQLVAWVKEDYPELIEGAKRTIELFTKNG